MFPTTPLIDLRLPIEYITVEYKNGLTTTFTKDALLASIQQYAAMVSMAMHHMQAQQQEQEAVQTPPMKMGVPKTLLDAIKSSREDSSEE